MTTIAATRCSVGIMAHNEEANIGRLLDGLIRQRQEAARIDEIIVVASGCTDATEQIVSAYTEADPRIRLITQATREGKASAVNLFIRVASGDILILQSADTLPEPTTIDELLAPFADEDVGMVGGRPIPTNGKETFMGFAGHLIWELHHQVSLRHPKCGELVGWRNSFLRIAQSAVDEANIEALIATQGWGVAYAPKAVVYNRAPMTVCDFVKQRRRIWAGHLQMKRVLGYRVSTMDSLRLLRYLARSTKKDLKSVIWTAGVVLLERYARLLGTWDVLVKKRDHTTWDIAGTTKVLSYDEQPVASHT